jgi:flagellar motor switch protein FliN/FliY
MSDETPAPPETPEAAEAQAESVEPQSGGPVDEEAAREQLPTEAIAGPLDDLPVYARGLLKIRVPVRVTLASQRKSIQEIVELGPGSIVKFDKTCDEPLELTVGERPIATGEVVKVGDKFGLRIGGLFAP